MNPGSILILALLLEAGGGKHKLSLPPVPMPRLPKGPAYIDTFKMELAVDRLQSITGALQKINHLNQVQKVPEPKGKLPSMERIQESLDAVKGLLAEGKPSRQVDTISNTLSGVKKLGNLEEIMASMGPVLSAMKDSGNK